MPYTFGGKLLGLGHLADIATFRGDTISNRAGSVAIFYDFPDKSGSPYLTDYLTAIDAQRSKHVGLASAVGSPCGAGTPESGSIRNVVTVCDRSLAT